MLQVNGSLQDHVEELRTVWEVTQPLTLALSNIPQESQPVHPSRRVATKSSTWKKDLGQRLPGHCFGTHKLGLRKSPQTQWPPAHAPTAGTEGLHMVFSFNS